MQIAIKDLWINQATPTVKASDYMLVDFTKKYLEGYSCKHTERYEYLGKNNRLDVLPLDTRAIDYFMGGDQWPPIRVYYAPVVELGKDIALRYECFNGAHRIAVAIYRGWEELEYEIVKPFIQIDMVNIYGHSKQYQSLVTPKGIMWGVRGLERWPHLTKGIKGCKILELGCNSGQDGIMAVLCGAESYTGYDLDINAIKYGQAVARMWKISNVTLERADLNHHIVNQKVDTVFLFSVAQRIDHNAIKKAIRNAKTKHIYCETHVGNDAASLNLMGALGYKFNKIAEYPASFETTKKRTLYYAEK